MQYSRELSTRLHPSDLRPHCTARTSRSSIFSMQCVLASQQTPAPGPHPGRFLLGHYLQEQLPLAQDTHVARAVKWLSLVSESRVGKVLRAFSSHTHNSPRWTVNFILALNGVLYIARGGMVLWLRQ